MTLRPSSVSRFLAENTLKPTGKVYVTSLLTIALSSAQPVRSLSEDSVQMCGEHLDLTSGWRELHRPKQGVPYKCRLTGL